MPPCAVKTCAVRPVFARVVGELRAADPSNVRGPVQQNASPGEQSEAPRPRWKQGQEQNSGPENQDSQHMLEQPRGYFPDITARLCEIFGGISGPEGLGTLVYGGFNRNTRLRVHGALLCFGTRLPFTGVSWPLWARGVSVESSVTAKETKIPKDIGPTTSVLDS